jgi:hypothetical protein
MHPIISHQMAALKAADFRREVELHNLHARARRTARPHDGASTVRSPLRQLRAVLAVLRMA